LSLIQLPSLRSALRATFVRELRIAGRNLAELANPWIFFIAVTLFVPLGLSAESKVLSVFGGGLVWILALLSVLLSLERIFQRDYDNGSLEQSILSGQPMYWLVSVKVFAHWCLTGLPLALLSPLLATMFAVPLKGWLALFLSLLFGGLAMSYVGALGAAMTVALRRGGLLISLIIIPFYLPLLIFGSEAVRSAQIGNPYVPHVMVLIAMAIFSVLFAPLAIGGALTVSMRE